MPSAVLDLARHVGISTLAGITAGLLVGGILGRVVMRISGFAAGPSMVGVHTENGNPVGDITLVGTSNLIVFAGIGFGLVGGLVYAVVEPWLRRIRPWHGLAFGAGLLAAAGSIVLDPANGDFRRFGPPSLNVAMFSALFVLFGVTIAWLVDRLRDTASGTGTAARVVQGLSWLALLPAVLLVLVATIAAGGTGAPFAALGLAAPLLVAVGVRWRGLSPLLGYAALAVPLLLGLVRTASDLPALLRPF